MSLVFGERHQKKRTVRLRGVRNIIGAVLCLSMAACGTSADNSNGLTIINFGDLSPNSDLTPFYAAVYDGFFQKEGITVNIQKFQGGGATSTAALATGAVQVASGGPTNFIGSTAKKAIDGKIFGETADRNYDLVVSKDITSMSQLKGKVLGVSGINSSDNIFLNATLAHYGISDKDVTYVTAGTTAQRLTALSTGKIQATAENATFRPSELEVGNALLKTEDNEVQIPQVAFWADSAYLTSHAPVLQRFLKAVADATNWVKDPANLKAAVDACQKGSGSTADQCQEEVQSAKEGSVGGPYTWSSTYAVNTTGMQNAIDATALLIPEAKSLKVQDVVDTSIAGTKP